MGLLTRYLTTETGATADGAPVSASESNDGPASLSTLEGVTWPETGESGFLTGGAVDRAAAMRVPALRRARNVVCGTVGMLPLGLWTADGVERIGRPRPWLRQPERDHTLAHTIAWTADDLFFYGRAWWRVVRSYRSDGLPLQFERIEPDRVTPERSSDGKRIVGWKVDDQLAPRTGDGRLVVFEHVDQGVLVGGGDTIATALALETAARNYANEPVPATALKNTNGVALTDRKVEELLTKWATARRKRSTAYLASLELEAIGFDPAALQLVEARQHAAVEIARLCNLDPDYVGANESGSSLTYVNVTQERRKLVDFTLRHYLTAIEQRLSLPDVVQRTTKVAFDLDDFLRGDAKDRADVYAINVPLGVMTKDEAREREGLAPGGTNPDQEADSDDA